MGCLNGHFAVNIFEIIFSVSECFSLYRSYLISILVLIFVYIYMSLWNRYHCYVIKWLELDGHLAHWKSDRIILSLSWQKYVHSIYFIKHTYFKSSHHSLSFENTHLYVYIRVYSTRVDCLFYCAPFSLCHSMIGCVVYTDIPLIGVD